GQPRRRGRHARARRFSVQHAAGKPNLRHPNDHSASPPPCERADNSAAADVTRRLSWHPGGLVMGEGLFAQLQSREPALLAALFTLVGGFVAQAGPGHINSMKALGTSVTVSGLQGVLTRSRVFSPATVSALVKGQGSVGASAGLPSVTPWLAQGAEPALAMSLVGLLAGFLLQVVGGAPDLLQALGISAGLAGTQGVVTRQTAYSPRTVALDQVALSTGRPSLITSLAAAAGAVVTSGVSPMAASAGGGSEAGSAPPMPTVAMGPGSTPPDPNVEPGLTSLLQRYRPILAYDSLESFFADSAAILTDRPGNVLKRQDGTLIASSIPGAGDAQLRLAFLGAKQYANGQPATASDYIEEVGGDYVAQAHQMHLIAAYANRVHGRVAVDSTGARWLQYWFFMYYDNPNFLGFGTHQGDLEMIQLRLDASGQPDVASYTQHRSGVRANWNQLELVPSADGLVPVTYSARGSHANLLRAGISVSERSFLPDHNDGQGPRIRPDLVVLSDTQAPWALWPGSWGGTHASGILGQVGISANSPTSPTRHLAWRDPAAFHASCDLSDDDLPEPGQVAAPPSPAPPAPQLTAERGPTSTIVHFTVPAEGGTPQPEKIVAGLVAADGTSPAATVSADIRGPAGTLELPLPSSAGPYEVRAAVHAASGLGSDTTTVPVT
ncbi:MAG: hypothetical protein WAK93_20980, partial [Solirubrobacteraceae bacterium]